ncbi:MULTISPECIES: TonB-dependent receptor [Pseudoalteromonas]|jgi:outer membrane receptor protein involved in Fe transport|uniref:Ligand-gated channel protein n=1 Tax=Pseudoalteromonas tetraodonis TaxID=43659 RepID=A0ABD4ENI4_9GAMM|nr:MULTISPECIES: TonB-dependent receptor [Pseudoalteromonas]KYL35581.1 ligand-gated channel protein [Pseudoalteromonas spiralis]MDN3395552.1 TonB-dependent receptor [Pseudoalteromonas sp. APC 3215]MDN3402286.1 TonB-dependent receptor [Pseudoalteromonas sp. APC 3213]MDN3406570.1 TonB-dependent receptor [Pseudoalteromonas sp. APC 3218]MDN3409123.1 TonB-dependent receptor [Pseudoalteromonas sp. APC 3894]|tara:strand:- start:2075 stop:4471 length:2397 start_codon:yes stop_codon:yes gene_type:complete
MKKFKRKILACAITTQLITSYHASAEEKPKVDKEIEQIEVTATRRSGSIQEAPLNITALNSDVIKDQNIGDLEDVARWVPGLTVSDQGGREGSPIIVRGLNTNSSDRGSDGGTVATYVGEIPLNINLRLTDIDRVEVLIGPQGTLYGAGTLGGAIRYLLKQPQLDITEGSVSGDLFAINESDDTGGEFGLVFNTPLIDDVLAVRASVNHYDRPGYIDYKYVVRNPGVSNPNPDFTNQDDIDENLQRVNDVNDEQITTGRFSVRWQPNSSIDATLNYFYQKQENGGNSTSQYGALANSSALQGTVGKYENAARVLEPGEQENDLLSLEIKADLGFAELVSASGWSSYEQSGQRDQTDLLYDIWTGYADFPAFVGQTLDTSDQDNFTQELRLVSASEGPLSWIVGGYYNKQENLSDDREYTPGLTDFWGGGIANVQKDLEYIALSNSEITEKALFGEAGYSFTDQFDITLGARLYEYDISTNAGSATPLYSGDFSSLDQIEMENVSANDNGNLFKFNANYTFDSGVLAYFTVSEGFRIGGGNGIAPCPDVLPEQQIVCALPSEEDYKADTTVNYELGFKSTWLRNRLHFNAALFNVDWNDAQVGSSTVNGQELITSNAGSANSKGVEISSRAIIGDHWTAYATYAYAKAELTEDAPDLFGIGIGAMNGDRLPGAPEHQFSFGLRYEQDVLDDKLLSVNYGMTAQSDMITKVGLRDDGETLAGYSLSNLSAKLTGDMWSATLYIDNLFDKYAFTSVRRDKSWAGMSTSGANKALPELQRVYAHYTTTPRTIGMKFTYNFEL